MLQSLKEMENKVYCKNCKWFVTTWRSCHHPDFKTPREARTKEHSQADGLPYNEKIEFFGILGDYKEYNRNNNCPYYQRKWWKFWLK